MSSTPRAGVDRLVAVPALDLRRSASHRSECVSESPMGSRLRVLAEREDGRWLFVRSPDGYRAWARSWGTVPDSAGWPERGCAVIVAAGSILAEPVSRAAPLSPIFFGARLALLAGRARGYREVGLPDGRRGWIRAGSIGPSTRGDSAAFWDPPPGRSPVARADHFEDADKAALLGGAASLLGVAYRWGGLGPTGIDCSGLVRLVFGLEGIPLPRDARDQAEALRPWRAKIPAGRLSPGDLVFFAPPGGRIDHVGIGVGGRGGRFLHASGCVRISGLDPADPAFEPDLAARVALVVRPPWGGGVPPKKGRHLA